MQYNVVWVVNAMTNINKSIFFEWGMDLESLEKEIVDVVNELRMMGVCDNNMKQSFRNAFMSEYNYETQYMMSNSSIDSAELKEELDDCYKKIEDTKSLLSEAACDLNKKKSLVFQLGELHYHLYEYHCLKPIDKDAHYRSIKKVLDKLLGLMEQRTQLRFAEMELNKI